MDRIVKSVFLPDLKTLKRFFSEHEGEYGDEKIRDRAKIDAELNIPTSDQKESSPYEEELRHEASSLASKVASTFRSSLEILDAKIKAESKFVEETHKNAVSHIEDIHRLENDASENSFGLKDAHKLYQVSEQRFNDLYSKLGRGPVAYVPHWLYLIFATAIFLGEIPLNALVFQIFGENQVMTWVMAFVIGLAVPLTAHFVGIKMREHGDGFSWANALKAIGAFSIITVTLYGLSVMRQTYLGEFSSELGLTDTLVSTSIMFFWLNLAVFCAAIIVAYLAHDPVPGFQNTQHGNAKMRKIVEKKERQRVKNFVKSGKKKMHALNQANEDYRDGLMKVVMLKGIYDQVLKDGQAYESRCLERLRRQLSVYRHENLRSRNGEGMPACFQNIPEFSLGLADVKEKLINDETEMSADV